MQHVFRLTLSHGNDRVEMDGVGARSGSIYHVSRDAIEGLWSSPSSKVSLSERETANGASPITDGEVLYAARTVTIPFHIQANYNHTNLTRSRTTLGRLIGKHDVVLDIYDDGDETQLTGYIETKYSDIPYEYVDTGTISFVCSDPRRVSKDVKSIDMRMASQASGGLSFGNPPLTTAWRGTANASSSEIHGTDGSVMASNNCINPKPVVSSGWNSWSDINGKDTGNGLQLTTINGGQQYGSYLEIQYCPVPTYGEFTVVATITQAAMSKPQFSGRGIFIVGLDANSNVVTGATWNIPFSTVGTHTATFTINNQGVKTFNLRLYGGNAKGDTITWKHIGVFVSGSYGNAKNAGVTWFDGDSQDSNANGGLVFPLDFGPTDNQGNVGQMTNDGSYVAQPVITLHGGMTNPLIHWITSDGHEGDLSYNGSVQNVPIVIDCDSRSATMGGLDVSYALGSRQWPSIPAGGSCNFSLLGSGSGWVTVQSHDVYI